MDFHATLGLALPLGLGIAAMGCGIGIGLAVQGAMNAMARQPELFSRLQGAMLVGAAFIEALTIYALVIAFVLSKKIA